MPGSQPTGDTPSHLSVFPESATGSEDSSFLVCRKLRSKMAFSAIESSDGEPVSAIEALQSTGVYWCLSTMECAGPDGALAHGSLCHAERGCYSARG
jgi:hypothetical protein